VNIRLLVVAAVAQLLVLGGMLVSASMPLWTGQEVRLATVPVDPRSLFRGNYARLSYEISQIESSMFPNLETLRHGEVVYILLNSHEGIAQLSGVSLEEPGDQLFIRGRLQHPAANIDQQNVNYGIEAYFAPKQKALALEAQLVTGGVAKVMLASNGKAALVELESR
tara:strand:- start:977 stop:1477 length:501 start_codon:yes stop_codon:yes gene_type:complete